MHQQNAVPYNNPAVSVGMIKLCRYVCLSHDWGCLSVYLRICKSLTCCCPYVSLGADTYASSEWQMISLLVTPPFGTCLWCHVCVSQIQRIVANLVCPQILNTCSFLQVRCDLGVLCSWLRAKTRTGSTRHKDICHLWCISTRQEQRVGSNLSCRQIRVFCRWERQAFGVNCSRAVAMLVGMSHS